VLRPELAMGLMIAASIPCTLASATVWTRRAGGNDAVAILVTMITNLVCFVVTPFWLWLTIGRTLPEGALDARAMVGKLAVIVVVPLVLAQIVRLWRPLASWATREKILLGVVSQLGILVMVLCSAVAAGRHLASEGAMRPTPLDWALLVACTVALHFSALCAGFLLARQLGLSLPDRIAVGFAGSQKTLMVGITVAAGFEGAALAILPMVIYHVGQLLIDTFVADWFRANSARPVPAESPAEEAAEDL
jgi:sodium/bile acid cotransporter 7